ncbi:MAG: DUF4276 family protein [Pseudomonadota bacterium]|nr:DUF4276 family protein [Pseudomonadota bacterium]
MHALPVMLRRFAERCGVYDLQIPQPIRVARDRFLNRDKEFEPKVALAGLKAGTDGLVLIVLDVDDDCPVTLARDVSTKAGPWLRGASCSVVLANREYESWLIAVAPSLAAKRGLPDLVDQPNNSESIRDAKGWLSERMVNHSGNAYRPVVDRAPLSAVVDLDAALANSRSLRKLAKCVSEYLEA